MSFRPEVFGEVSLSYPKPKVVASPVPFAVGISRLFQFGAWRGGSQDEPTNRSLAIDCRLLALTPFFPAVILRSMFDVQCSVFASDN